MRSDRGSAVAEFIMVGALLTALTLAVMQLALALHVRNTAIDAAAEGARFAALADARLDDGVRRTRELIGSALGPQYPVEVEARVDEVGGYRSTAIVVRGDLPVIGLFGLGRGMEVTGHAVVESLE